MARKSIFALLSICVIMAIFATISSSQSGPATFATVAVDNLTHKVWDEKSSLFLLTSDVPLSLLSTPFQKIIIQKNVNNRHGIIIKTGKCNDCNDPPTAKDYKDTRLLNINHPIIQEYAKRVKSTPNPIAEAEKIVFNTITTKTEGIPIIPAPMVFELKKGDCTEHAIATIALLRALKIPSRAVVGMILAKEYASKSNIFVFHMWAFAYYNNQWVLVDATRPGKKTPNHYIAFAYHSLETEMPLEFLEALSTIQNLTATYLSE